MWWSPGILVAGVIALVCYHYLGSAMPWWTWIGLIVVAIIVDAMFGIERKREVSHKTRTVYRGKDSS